jgi:hypothetical protein
VILTRTAAIKTSKISRKIFGQGEKKYSASKTRVRAGSETGRLRSSGNGKSSNSIGRSSQDMKGFLSNFSARALAEIAVDIHQ